MKNLDSTKHPNGQWDQSQRRNCLRRLRYSKILDREPTNLTNLWILKDIIIVQNTEILNQKYGILNLHKDSINQQLEFLEQEPTVLGTMTYQMKENMYCLRTEAKESENSGFHLGIHLSTNLVNKFQVYSY